MYGLAFPGAGGPTPSKHRQVVTAKEKQVHTIVRREKGISPSVFIKFECPDVCSELRTTSWLHHKSTTRHDLPPSSIPSLYEAEKMLLFGQGLASDSGDQHSITQHSVSLSA